jgi:caffeoyl-CoA O-methyltransferase
LAEGLRPGGQLHTIDINEELEDRVRSYFDRSEFRSQLNLHIGNALDIIPTLEHNWDLVFIDADKENYVHYFDSVISRMNTGGVIIADNVLWSGKVITDEVLTDSETKALHEYNEKVSNDPRVESLLMPVRDGLMICRVR